MAFQKTILSQILDHVNRSDFQKQVSGHSGDHKTHRLSCWNLLVLMLHAQLQAKKSLPDLLATLRPMASDFYHLGLKSTARTTIYDGLAKRPSAVFEGFFQSTFTLLNRRDKRRMGKLFLIDSTTISLCMSQFNWASFRSAKAGIKIHTIYDPALAAPVKAIIGNARQHDLTGIKGAVDFEPGAVYVFDRAYASYPYMHEIAENGAFFVTRMKSNWLYHEVKDNGITCISDIVDDQTIAAVGENADVYPDNLRLVSMRWKGKVLQFLTNNHELSAERIAEIYKTRWQIELFFKWLKQHLRVKSFFSTSHNGVLVQIWCSLIAFLMLRLLQATLIREFTLHELLRRIQDHLGRRMDLHVLLDPGGGGRHMPEETQEGWLFS